MGEVTGQTGFWTRIGLLLRRRQVVVPAAVASVLLGATAYFVTPVSYTSSALMVLTTTEYGGTESQDPAKPTDLSNPLLSFNESLTTTSAIIIQAMNTKEVARELDADGATKVVIDDGRSNPELLGQNGPFLYIHVEGDSPDRTARTVGQAQSLMRDKLLEWQESVGAPKKTFVTLADVVPGTHPVADHSRGLKLGLLALLVGFFVVLGGAYVRDRLGARRPLRPQPSDDAVTAHVDTPGSAPALSTIRSLLHLPVEDEAPDRDPDRAPDTTPDPRPAGQPAPRPVRVRQPTWPAPLSARTNGSAKPRPAVSSARAKKPGAAPGAVPVRAKKPGPAATPATSSTKRPRPSLVEPRSGQAKPSTIRVPVKTQGRPRSR